jgi:hypothetical protein
MTKKQLSAQEFSTLAVHDQLDLLRGDGVYVGKLKGDGGATIFFQLYHFYVEVLYEDYRTTIKSLKVSENPESLQPYLNQVIVKDLDSHLKSEAEPE